jgi:hypothetical protein
METAGEERTVEIPSGCCWDSISHLIKHQKIQGEKGMEAALKEVGGSL